MAWAVPVTSSSPTRHLILSGALAAAIFAIDVALPRGHAVHMGYVAVVLSGLWWPRRSHVVSGAALCGALTLLGGEPTLNRFETLTLLAIAAAVVMAFKRTCSRASDLAAIVDSSGDAIVSVTREGVVRSWNRGAARLLGRSAEVMVGRPSWDLVPPELVDDARVLLDRVLSGQALDPIDFVVVDAAGRRIDVSLRASPLLGPSGDVVAAAVFVRDISDRRAAAAHDDRLRSAEAALAHMARVVTIGELSTAIAHELNQPLAGITANGAACRRWLEASPPDLAAARRSVELLIDDARRASAVVERVRAALRKAPPARQALDINSLISETVALAQRHARTAKATLRTDLGAGLPPVIGDPVRVQQVLLNLVVNAVDATAASPHGSRDVTISSVSAPPDAVRISVRDSGPGIAPELRERIFEPFFTTKPHGLGLGLTLSASLVEQMGGRLQVQPAEVGGHLELHLPTRAA